jgi:hypothetical protein
MSSARYVYVKDEGHVFGSADAPTPEDFAHAGAGVTTIIRLADGCYYGRERRWLPVPPGILGRAEIEDEPALPFHVPAAYAEE